MRIGVLSCLQRVCHRRLICVWMDAEVAMASSIRLALNTVSAWHRTCSVNVKDPCPRPLLGKAGKAVLPYEVSYGAVRG